MSPHTIQYRGYQIDPVHDPEEKGGWPVCSLEEATFFRVYPPQNARPALDAEAYTLEQAKKAVDEDLANPEVPVMRLATQYIPGDDYIQGDKF